MSHSDPFQIQAREQAAARAANTALGATATPDLDAMPELSNQMRATLDDFARWRKVLQPHTRPTRRRQLTRALARLRRRFRTARQFHPAMLRLQLGVAWLRFLLFWPTLWRLLLALAALAALLAGLRWLIDNVDQVQQLLQG